MIKRAIDVIAASVGLVLSLPLMLVIAALIKKDSPGPVLFKQQRIGRGFIPFTIYKFRTMVSEPVRGGPLVTVSGDSRVTRIGIVIRRLKIDELPQLLNVLRGEMSLVGPRPEVQRYVEMFRNDYEQILSVRPGITDPASIHFRNESDLLAEASDPEELYTQHILPFKLKLAKDYIEKTSLVYDLRILGTTLVKIWDHTRPS